MEEQKLIKVEIIKNLLDRVQIHHELIKRIGATAKKQPIRSGELIILANELNDMTNLLNEVGEKAMLYVTADIVIETRTAIEKSKEVCNKVRNYLNDSSMSYLSVN